MHLQHTTCTRETYSLKRKLVYMNIYIRAQFAKTLLISFGKWTAHLRKFDKEYSFYMFMCIKLVLGLK